MNLSHTVCGDRETFAVECCIEFQTDTPARNPAGSLWFWVGGQQVGNPDVISLPAIAVNEMQQTLQWCGHRSDSNLYAADQRTALDAIFRGLYDTPASRDLDPQRWARFLICMTPGGHEYVDGWFVVMIEASERSPASRDRVLYRRSTLQDTSEVWIPQGAYRAAVQQFIEWFSACKKSKA